MKKFFTEYQHNGKRYGEHIYADSIEQAESILKSKKNRKKLLVMTPPKSIYLIKSLSRKNLILFSTFNTLSKQSFLFLYPSNLQQ